MRFARSAIVPLRMREPGPGAPYAKAKGATMVSFIENIYAAVSLFSTVLPNRIQSKIQ